MSTKTAYRPDIDGLRAIAILTVILFHAGFPFLTGGFIGVDVFFVISGFLITSLIEKEITEKRFSFKIFYLRRIRRIIPALVFTMLIITIPACYFLLDNHLKAYSKTLINTLICRNNIHLCSMTGDYFSEKSELMPFLHTWSLSIEEQFYFILPPLLLLLHKKLNLQIRLWVVTLLCILGIFFSYYQATANPNKAYFLLPARLFEMLMGSCLAMFWTKLPDLNKQKNNILSIAGILLILIPAFLLDRSSIFPGFNAFWPCLGTVILLSTGKSEKHKGIINQLIQNKLMIGIGLISYSLYLWHWPIFVLIKYIGLNFTGVVRAIAILITFVLSYLTWRFVEQPFRTTMKFNFTKTILIILLPSFGLISMIYGIITIKDGFPQRHCELTEFIPKKNFPEELRKECFQKLKVGNCEDCFIGIKKDTLDGVLIGDSFANHTAAFLDVLAKDAGLYIHDSAAQGSPFISHLNQNNTPTKLDKYKIDRLNYAKKFKNIFIAANWESCKPQNKTYQSTLKNLEELIKIGKRIIIFDALRNIGDMNLHRAKMAKAKMAIGLSQQDFAIKEYKRPEDYIIYEIKRKFPSIIVIDLNEVMCKNGDCEIELNKTIVYRNQDHLNTSGARLIGEMYLKTHFNPLKILNIKH